MNLKSLIILSFSLMMSLYTATVVGQPRTNSHSLVKRQSKSEILNNPIGWSFSDCDKKWCGHIGLCLSEYKQNEIRPVQLSTMTLSGYGQRGIISLQFEKLSVRDNIYYMLTQIYWDGEYKYPHIETGWYYYQSCNIYIFTPSEYDKLFNLSSGINVIKVFDVTGTSYPNTQKAKDYIEANLNRIFEEPIPDSISTNPKMAYYNPHYFYVKLEEDGKTIRFQLPNNKELEGITEQKTIGLLDKHKWLDIDKEYFEVPLTKWTLLKIK